ncbi:MAG: UTP--glucose-1-phosphate uridylyltransferase [Epsilonproteobacteria bacterium]|nr:MAG: UTP--glucose-1-phosphate uridylyltransferase [Campylobacterota bacterium]
MNKTKQIKKCLFPAAGYGTRFLPATKAIPKEMLPILTKPLIQYGVEEAKQADIDTMAIVTGRGKRSIEDHFDVSYELEHQIKDTSKEHYLFDIRKLINNLTFTYVRQKSMKGLGDAILTGRSLIGDEPFAVVLADDLCVSDSIGVLSQMINIYNKYGKSVVAIETIDKKDSNKYGIIDGKEIEKSLYQISNMIEKPAPKDAPTNLAIIGRYILTPDIFDILKNTKPGIAGEVQITDALQTMAKKDQVLGLKFDGRRFDCGSLDGFVQATNYFANLENI